MITNTRRRPSGIKATVINNETEAIEYFATSVDDHLKLAELLDKYKQLYFIRNAFESS